MKKYSHLIVILISVWLILAIVFGIFDLDISKQIVNQNSVWAKFLENYGMIPGLLVVFSGIYIYSSHIKQKRDLWAWVMKVIFFLASTGLIIYLLDIILSHSLSNNFVTEHFLIFLIISLIVSIMIFIILHVKKSVKDTIYINYAKIVLSTTIIGYVVFIQGVKYFWGRVRFRELDSVFSQFTPWYLPQGITGFDSFPSGHAAMGWMLLPLLIFFVNKKPWQKSIVMSIIFLWSFILALSRVVIGAHYASDVLFGSFFITITYDIIQQKISIDK